MKKTDVFMGETANIVFKLDGVSAVSFSFIVVVEPPVSGSNNSYVLSVPVNGSQAIYLCYDVERTVNWSYSVARPRIVVKNCTVDVWSSAMP